MQADAVQKTKQRIIAARSQLLAALEELDDAAWDWRPEDGRWSVRLTLAHLGSAQWSHLEVARRLVDDQPVHIPDFDLDAWNAAQVARRADWTVAQILADLEAAHQATLAFLEGLDAANLAVTGVHPALGTLSVGQILRVVALHDNLHRRDVLKLLREMGRPPQEA
jgi:uncharacterized damage-inducible protein DinB